MQRAFALVEPTGRRRNLVPVSSDCIDREGKEDQADRRGCNARRARNKPYR